MKRAGLHFYVLWLSILFTGCADPYAHCYVDATAVARNDSILERESFRGPVRDIMDQVGEPMLQERNVRAYRLTLLHSFSKGVWVFRCTQTSDGGVLLVKKKFSRHYMDIDEPMRDTAYSKVISSHQWTSLENEIRSSCFWTMPPIIDRSGLDGTTYILEAKDPGSQTPTERSYHAVGRWAPPDSSEFRKICRIIYDM